MLNGTEISAYCKRIGFGSNIPFIPVVGLKGINLINKASDEMPWYKGPSLIGAFDQYIQPPSRPSDKPFRLAVSVRIVAITTVDVPVFCF